MTWKPNESPWSDKELEAKKKELEAKTRHLRLLKCSLFSPYFSLFPLLKTTGKSSTRILRRCRGGLKCVCVPTWLRPIGQGEARGWCVFACWLHWGPSVKGRLVDGAGLKADVSLKFSKKRSSQLERAWELFHSTSHLCFKATLSLYKWASNLLWR